MLSKTGMKMRTLVDLKGFEKKTLGSFNPLIFVTFKYNPVLLKHSLTLFNFFHKRVFPNDMNFFLDSTLSARNIGMQ